MRDVLPYVFHGTFLLALILYVFLCASYDQSLDGDVVNRESRWCSPMQMSDVMNWNRWLMVNICIHIIYYIRIDL